MGAGWFVDGAYLMRWWNSLRRPDMLDCAKLRAHLEAKYCDQVGSERIEEAYYFMQTRSRQRRSKTLSTTRWPFRHRGARG